jgi:hypothetical protein
MLVTSGAYIRTTYPDHSLAPPRRPPWLSEKLRADLPGERLPRCYIRNEQLSRPVDKDLLGC